MREDLVVVVCTYDGEQYVAEQIRSICRQTVLPARIAVFDDDSSDGTIEAVRRAFDDRGPAAADVVLTVHLNTGGGQLGPARNFERAITGTSEGIVALSDQDDVWSPRRLERALDALDADSALSLVASDANLVDADGHGSGQTVWDAERVSADDRAATARGELLPVLLRQNIAPGMTFTLRRRFVEDHLPLPPGVMHDYWFLLNAAARGTARVVAEPLVDYRLHGRNAVGLLNGRFGLRRRAAVWRKIARTPLTDWAQWARVVDGLQAHDPGGHLAAARDKASFELRRRYVGRRRPFRLRAFAALVRSRDYERFEHTGLRGAVKDLVRPSAVDAGASGPRG